MRPLHETAIILLVLLAPFAAGYGTTTRAAGSCANYDDDPGFGGSDVWCNLPCKDGQALVAAGHAVDPDASVAVAYNCGGQGAGCAVPTPTCGGISPGLTSYSQAAAKCRAESDEFFSSMVFVACATLQVLPAHGTDPVDEVCDAVGDRFPPCRDVARWTEFDVARTCSLQQWEHLEGLMQILRQVVLAAPGKANLSSLVAIVLTPQETSTVIYEINPDGVAECFIQSV